MVLVLSLPVHNHWDIMDGFLNYNISQILAGWGAGSVTTWGIPTCTWVHLQNQTRNLATAVQVSIDTAVQHCEVRNWVQGFGMLCQPSFTLFVGHNEHHSDVSRCSLMMPCWCCWAVGKDQDYLDWNPSVVTYSCVFGQNIMLGGNDHILGWSLNSQVCPRTPAGMCTLWVWRGSDKPNPCQPMAITCGFFWPRSDVILG